MADIKSKYRSTSSIALTLALASLASDTSLLAGRASTAVDNSTNLDLDHLLSGTIRTGTTPTVNKTIEVWVYAPISIAAGVPSYPDGITGSDANKSMTSLNVKNMAMKLAGVMSVDATTGRDFSLAPVSIAGLFGVMPMFWGVFVVQDTGAALNATQVALSYMPYQSQTV